MKRKLLSILALLCLTVCSAWADGITVTFSGNGHTKVIENVTLPHKFSCENGSTLDQIIREFYDGVTGQCYYIVLHYGSNMEVSGTSLTISGNITSSEVGCNYAVSTQTGPSGWQDYNLNITVSGAPTPTSASWTSGGCTVTLNNGALTVSKTNPSSATGNMADYNPYTIPWGSYASDITSIVIEPGVTHIGNYAFYCCNNASLAPVTLPASVTTIGTYAFFNCSMETVVIGSGVTNIGASAFSQCNNVNEVYSYANPSALSWNSGSQDFNLHGAQWKPTCYVFNASDWSSFSSVNVNFATLSTAKKAVSGVTARQDPANTSNYWSTYFHPAANVKINTTGVQIFKASLSGDELTLTPVDGNNIIPAGQAVVLKATTAGALSMELTPDAATGDFSSNELKGTAVSMTGEAGNIYVLSAKAGTGAGFYKLSSTGTIGANKAYLVYNASPTTAREFFGFDEATAIESLTQTISEGEGACYDLQGRRVARPTKGLYIVNGKMVVIK